MATVAQLAARPYQEIGWLFVVEGWPVAFSNRVELTGTGASAWIGTGQGARTVALGLEPPKSVKLGIGIVESGLPCDDGLTLTIVDRDGYLVDLMTDEDGTLVTERLPPGTTAGEPAPTSLTTLDGNTVNPRGKWINGESIGSSGERRQFQILPGDPMPGYDHPAIDSAESSLRLSSVRDEARWLEGLPCALYLIRRDVDAGTWPSWSDQYASGYSLVWWGSLRSASAESRAWTLQCDGPSSWLRKTMNVTMPDTWRLMTPYLSLATGQDQMACAFSLRAPLDETESCGTSAYAADAGNTLTSGQTPAELAAEINTRLQAIAGAAGTDGTWTTFTNVNGEVSFTTSGVSIKVDENTASTNSYPLAGVLQLRMHKNAWLHLGWDLQVQGVAVGAARKSKYEVGTQALDDKVFYPVEGGATADPGDGYWEATFTTFPLGFGWADGFHVADGKGAQSKYEPVYGKAGSTSVLYPDAQQVVDVGFGYDAPYLFGQLAKPAADVTLDSGACDRAGFILVRGPWRPSLEDEPRTVHQLARVSWNDDGGKVGADTDGRAVMWLEQWLNPSRWGGADDMSIWKSGTEKRPWAMKSGQVEWCPVALLSYLCGENGWADAAHVVLLRMLLSTGTASWSAVGDAATPTSGDNAHADASGAADDREVVDLGLGIPQELIDWDSFEDAADAIPGGKKGDLNRCRLAFVGPFDSQEVIESILAPRGWCFSLRDGKYGLFARSAPLTLDDVEVALTQAMVAADVDDTPPAESVDFRPLEPLDLVTVRYGASPWGDDGRERELQVKARDPRAHTRRGNAKVDVDGRALTAGGAWTDEFTELWGNQLARWYGAPHATVRVAIKGDTARDLWPGTVVSYTSDWPATRAGTYGMTARVGRVISTELDTQTMAKTCEILVEGFDPAERRVFAPIARMVDTHATVEARHDSATRTIYCQADAFGRGGATRDVAAFAEPSWSSTGGNLVAFWYHSYDGVTWEGVGYFAVESVSTANNSITYVAGTLTPSTGIAESRYGLIIGATHDSQTGGTWPHEVFGVVCDVDGKFGASDVAGYPWAE